MSWVLSLELLPCRGFILAPSPFLSDFLFKFLVIGSAGTGKSCLLHQFIENKCKFSPRCPVTVLLASQGKCFCHERDLEAFPETFARPVNHNFPDETVGKVSLPTTQSNKTPTTPSAWSSAPEWSMSVGRRSNCRSGTPPARNGFGNNLPDFNNYYWRPCRPFTSADS